MTTMTLTSTPGPRPAADSPLGPTLAHVRWPSASLPGDGNADVRPHFLGGGMTVQAAVQRCTWCQAFAHTMGGDSGDDARASPGPQQRGVIDRSLDADGPLSGLVRRSDAGRNAPVANASVLLGVRARDGQRGTQQASGALYRAAAVTALRDAQTGIFLGMAAERDGAGRYKMQVTAVGRLSAYYRSRFEVGPPDWLSALSPSGMMSATATLAIRRLLKRPGAVAAGSGGR